MSHIFDIRVYYEDTDLAGIVYYANYLKFIERARSEWVRALGIDQAAMKAQGLFFAVRKVSADYLTPAVYDDLLQVLTRPTAMTGARMVLRQEITRGDTRVFAADVTIVCLDQAGRAARLPKGLRVALG